MQCVFIQFIQSLTSYIACAIRSEGKARNVTQALLETHTGHLGHFPIDATDFLAGCFSVCYSTLYVQIPKASKRSVWKEE